MFSLNMLERHLKSNWIFKSGFFFGNCLKFNNNKTQNLRLILQTINLSNKYENILWNSAEFQFKFLNNLGIIVHHFESSSQTVRISQNFLFKLIRSFCILDLWNQAQKKWIKNTFEIISIATDLQSSYFIIVELNVQKEGNMKKHWENHFFNGLYKYDEIYMPYA